MTTQSKRPHTPNRGAADVRAEMLVHLRGMAIADVYLARHIGWNDAVDEMETFVRGMAKRAGRRPGGLGRKAKRG